MQDSNKQYIIQGFMGLIAFIYILRLFYLQVWDSSYQSEAASNAIKRVVQIPHRGQIYDRTSKLIVMNSPVYDMYITPKKVRVADTLRFCKLFDISRQEFDSLSKEARKYSPVKPSLFIRNLSVEDFARVQDAMVDFSGFHFENSALRSYSSDALANVLGYTGEISKKKLESQTDSYYRQGDYLGLSGLEQYYEKVLRGRRGIHFQMVDVHGIDKGAWKGGENDTIAVAGKNLYTSIDIELQQYAESLMKHKVGSIIAIEPSTGEILAMVSAPSYDPRLLTGRNFSKYYRTLLNDPYKPLLNRPIIGYYRPGSTFKTVQALIGLQEQVVLPSTVFICGNTPVRCHAGHPSGDIRNAIRFSCNPYFYNVFRKIINNNNEINPFKAAAIGVNRWNEYAIRFGIGQKLGIDIPNEQAGLLPSVKMYNRRYKGEYKWKFSNIYSVAIGEGELVITPFKMANVAAIIANRGWYITPHLVKGVEKKGLLPDSLKKRHETGINPYYYEVVIDGMQAAFESGTVSGAARIPGITICGKTGTSENKRGKVTIGEDHAIFMGFAPRDKPKIAVAAFIENAGFGGSSSAPIASLVIEKYLTREVKRTGLENAMREKNFLMNVSRSAAHSTPHAIKTMIDSVKTTKSIIVGKLVIKKN